MTGASRLSGFGGSAAPGGDHGAYALFINSVGTNATTQAYVNISSTTAIYLFCEFYMTAAAVTAFAAGTSHFSADFLSINAANSPTTANEWEGIFLTDRNASSVEDGNVYFDDFYSVASYRKMVVPDTWMTVEAAYRVNASNHWETNWRINGVEAYWEDNNPFFTDYPADLSGLTTAVVGQTGTFNAPQQFYIDNLKIATDTWVGSGGTVVFTGDFETGDFSQFTGTTGSPSLATPP